jgi:hypothetical protein
MTSNMNTDTVDFEKEIPVKVYNHLKNLADKVDAASSLSAH